MFLALIQYLTKSLKREKHESKKVTANIFVNFRLLGILHSNIQAGETEQTDFIERFYQNIMNRTADSKGMTTWLNTIQK